MKLRSSALTALLGLAIGLAPFAHAFADDDDDDGGDDRPGFIRGEILETRYDGVTDDLLTGGLGKTGLAGLAPTFADPENPTVAELRTLAIYNNYRALVDFSTGGGYGVLYGPNIDAQGKDTLGEGLVPGTEFIAFADNGTGRKNVTMMVQVPDSFDPEAPCIVTAPSSGSRGVYGAIATAGEWGLDNGCAVAYTDKGTGTGAHDLQDNTINLITGLRADADAAGKDSNFTAKLSDSKREAFNEATSDRFAFKHAHSRQNPEADWGKNVLQSVKFAFFVLNRMFGTGDDDDDDGGGQRITPENTIVIASSVSNGGGSSVLAAELDDEDWVDGVTVSEPNVNPEFDSRFSIVQGTNAPIFEHSRSLYDYTTALNVYQGCANLDPAIAAAGFNLFGTGGPFEALGAARCASLAAKGLLTAPDQDGQAAEAQQILNDDFAIQPEQNIVQPSHWSAFVSQAISVTYANAYSRSRVTENLCGYSFGAVDGDFAPAPLPAAAEAALFGSSNGIPRTGGVEVINNDSPGGALRDSFSLSASQSEGDISDQNLDGALCLRSLATGRNPESGAALTGDLRRTHRRLLDGIEEIRASGDLQGKPAIFVTGRSDAILPINHTSRPYFGLNQLEEGAGSGLRYYEVLNAQHLDVFNALFIEFAENYIPLHHYFNRAMDLMFDHLKNGEPLPPSQVVRTTPRGPGAPQISLANLPEIELSPAVGDQITFVNNQVRIPE